MKCCCEFIGKTTGDTFWAKRCALHDFHLKRVETENGKLKKQIKKLKQQHREYMLPRGAIKEFRHHLNTMAGNPHRNGRYQQKTRQYGDYLYHQDREKFMVDLREWLKL